MSAIKTHDVYHVIQGDEVLVTQDEGETRFAVKSLLLDRQRPSVCQIFTQSENKGSFSSNETKAWNCKIVTTEPSPHSVKFNVKAIVGDSAQMLQLTSVKAESSECIIC